MADANKDEEVMDPSPKIKEKEMMNSGSTSDGFEVIDAPSDSSDDFPTNSEHNFDSIQLPVTDITRDISLPPENIKYPHATVINQSSEVHVSVSIPIDDSLPETIQEKTTQGHRLDKTNETFFSMAENPEPSRNVDDVRKSTAKVSCDSSTGAVTDTSNSDTKTQESWVKELHLKKLGPQWVLFYCGNTITIPRNLAKNQTTTLSVDEDTGDVFIVSEDDMYKLSRTNDNKIKLTSLDSAELDNEQEKSDACGATDGETYIESGQVDRVARVENTAALSDVAPELKAKSTLPRETGEKNSDSTVVYKSENAEKTEDNAQDDLSGDSKHEYLETVESMESNQLSVYDDHMVVNTKPISNAENVSRDQKLQMEKSVLSKETVGQGRKYDNTETVDSEKGKSDSDKTPCVQQEKKCGINENPIAVSEAGDYVELVKTPAIVGGSDIMDDVESLTQGFSNLRVISSAASDNQQPDTGTSATVHSAAGCDEKQGQMMPGIGKGLSGKPNVATDKTEAGKHKSTGESDTAVKKRKLPDTPDTGVQLKNTNASRPEGEANVSEAGNAKGKMAVTTEHVLLAIHCEKRRPGDTNYSPSKIIEQIDRDMDTYMKWQFVLHSPEFLSSVAAKIKSSHGYSLSVSADGTCTVTIGKVAKTPDSNKIVDLVTKNILSQSSAIESLAFPHGGLNSQDIADSIMNSKWGRQHLVYAEVGKNPNADLVNFAYDTQNVTTSCRSRIIKDGTDRAKQQKQLNEEAIQPTQSDRELSFELIYKNVIGNEDVIKDFKMKFPSVSLNMFCKNNRFIVRMKGPEKDVSAAEGHIKAIRSEFTMNQMSLTDIKHFDETRHSLETLCMILNSVFQKMFQDKDFKYGNCYWSVDDKRLYILAREQTSADKITGCFKKCLASVTRESEIKNPEEVLASCVDPVNSDMLFEKRVVDNKVYIVGKKDVVRGIEDKFDTHCKAVASRPLMSSPIAEDIVPKLTKTKSCNTTGGPSVLKFAKSQSYTDAYHPLQSPGSEVPLNKDFGVDVKFTKEGQVLELYGGVDAIKNASNAVEALAKTVLTADVECPGIAGGYFKSPEGSALLHTLERDYRVTTEVIGSSDEGASGGDGDRERECSPRIWTFTTGHAVMVCLGDQKNYWQDLLVENQEMQRNELTDLPVINQEGRKTVKLPIPKYNGNNKAKDTFCQSICKVLESAKTYDCTKVCIDLDQRYDWPYRKFNVQLFTEVAGHLSQTGLIPTAVTFCTAEQATYREACQVCCDAVAKHDAVESVEPLQHPVTGNFDSSLR